MNPNYRDRHKRKKPWCIILVIVLILSSLTGCQTGNISETMDDGANEFSSGKQTNDPEFFSSDETLEALAVRFSAAQERPVGKPMSPDDADSIAETSDDPTQPTTSTGPDDPSNPTNISKPAEDVDNDITPPAMIRDREDLKRAFHYMMARTSSSDVFLIDRNYSPGYEDMDRTYIELESEDAYDGICVKSYSWGDTSDGRFVLSIDYHLPVEKIKQIKKETRQLAKKALKNIPKKGSDPYKIVRSVNDYLCDIIEYPEEEPYEVVTHTAYGAFQNESAVCDGYSRAAKILLNERGIDCYMETGNTEGGGHAWNLVKLEGEWYQLDVTWNDANRTYNSDISDDDEFFLVTDSYMRQSRIWDENIWPESASHNYMKQ